MLKYIPLVLMLAIIIALIVSAWKMRDRVEVLGEFFTFLKERKLWWIMPLLIIFLVAGLFVVITANSGVAAMIYPLF